MQKILLFTAALLMNALVLNAEKKTVEEEGFYFRIDTETKEAKLVYHESYANMTTATIPDALGDIMSPSNFYVVNEIESGAFEGCTKLTSVTIPVAVKKIGTYQTFKGCRKLTSINVDKDNAYYSSQNGVLFTKDKDTIVCFPPGKTGDYTIPNTIKAIYSYTFSDSCRLSTLTIPSSVDTIEADNFSNAFIYFSNLTAINVDPANPKYCSEDGVLFNKDKTLLINHPICKAGAYTIPSTVTGLAGFAFAFCTGLTSVDIPSGVTKLPDYTFVGCTGLQYITCRNTVAPLKLGQFVFGGSFYSFNIPEVDKSTCIVTVPSEVMAAYKSTNEWQDFAHIRGIYSFHYVDKEAQELGSESYILNVPDAPEIDGFTFLRWEPVAADIANGITIQAMYQSNTPSNAPEVYTNPANPAQKLIRNGNVYVLSNGETYTITGAKIR